MQEYMEFLDNPKYLCEMLFKADDGKPLELSDFQEEIVDIILHKKFRKNLCWAATRAGKSLAISVGIILLAIFRPGEKIRIIAPTTDHTKIIMGYITQHLFDNELILNELTIDTAGMGIERLKKELSKQRLTFKNGSEVMIITASISTEGRTLIGFGGTAIFVDEAEKIPVDIVKSKIMRMLGDTEDYIVFFISNPIQRGYMYEKMKEDGWKKIHVDWKRAVKEGRLSEAFVMERKAELSPMEFNIWYEAKYPEDMEDTLIKWEWIEKAEGSHVGDKGEKMVGVDVAEKGSNFTVIISVLKVGKIYIIKDIRRYHEADTMITTGNVIKQLKAFKTKNVNVDAIGVGKGVADRLEEQNYDVSAIKVGMSSDRETERFLNLKAQFYWNLRTVFEEGRIIIPDIEYAGDLKRELNMMRWELNSSGKIRIIDPQKSPDFADSLMLALSKGGEEWHGVTDDSGLIFG